MEDKDLPDRHPAFLFFFTNILFLLIIAIAWLVLNVLLSIRMDNWMWFARSGALVVIIGGILSFRNTLRLTKAYRVRMRNMTAVESFSESEKADQEKDSVAIIIGVSMMVIGTMIWAYGDLLMEIV